MKNSGSEETFVMTKWFTHFSLLVQYSYSNARKNLVCANKVLLVLRQRGGREVEREWDSSMI